MLPIFHFKWILVLCEKHPFQLWEDVLSFIDGGDTTLASGEFRVILKWTMIASQL